MKPEQSEEMKQLIREVRAIREVANIPINKFALAIGVWPQNWHSWIKGAASPNGEVTLRMLKWRELHLNAIVLKPKVQKAYKAKLKELEAANGN